MRAGVLSRSLILGFTSVLDAAEDDDGNVVTGYGAGGDSANGVDLPRPRGRGPNPGSSFLEVFLGDTGPKTRVLEPPQGLHSPKQGTLKRERFWFSCFLSSCTLQTLAPEFLCTQTATAKI